MFYKQNYYYKNGNEKVNYKLDMEKSKFDNDEYLKYKDMYV